MTGEGPRDYDREHCRGASGPLQVRIGLDREKDTVTRFIIQLEYHHDGDWHPVVRYGHDGTGESGHSHDIVDEGLHVDIFRDGEKHATEYILAVRSGAEGLNRVEEQLSNNLQRFTNRYEQWHGINHR